MSNITAHDCGATAHLPTFLKPGTFTVRATFRGNELTDQVTVSEGKPLPNRIQVNCQPSEVVAGATVSCALRASDSFGNELKGAALAGMDAREYILRVHRYAHNGEKGQTHTVTAHTRGYGVSATCTVPILHVSNTPHQQLLPWTLLRVRQQCTS